MNVFEFSGTPKIIFGSGETEKLGRVACQFGNRVLLVHGKNSFTSSRYYSTICKSIIDSSIIFSDYEIPHEPAPELIDNAVSMFYDRSIQCVIAIGGGSVIDSGKAVSAMLTSGAPVSDYLEIIGRYKPDGKKVPFIAIPTTSGTGSEATSNAVISRVGVNGFKRSLRHANYTPDIALIDPKLAVTCPSDITAACGLDALTQLLESYVSTKSSPFTDALIEKALPFAGNNLVNAVKNGETDLLARECMAYASLVSGITLSNAGLGVVHGLASVLGAAFPISHGVVCGTLLAPSVKKTIDRLASENSESTALRKYATACRLLTNKEYNDTLTACYVLVEYLEKLTHTLSIKNLSAYGITKNHFKLILNENCNKNNPVQLSDSEIISILESRTN
jgi:alcohol dehydrogenase class IV